MTKHIFDFEEIKTYDDFYRLAALELNLPDYFGNNLDALWDSLTGDIELPIDIEFINLSLDQLDEFEDLLLLFEDAAMDFEEEIFFEFSLRKEDMDLLMNE